jgi:B12-binding domain/radical SAM domain protein
MKRKTRFTFVVDRLNRTGTATLIAALERVTEDVNGSVRVVGPEGVSAVGFTSKRKFRDILCMSSMTEGFPQVRRMLRALVSKWGEHAFLSICGGSHPSGDPGAVLQSGFDYCCVGEGEATVAEIARRGGAGGRLPSIAGLFHLLDGKIVGQPRPDSVDLDLYDALPRRINFPTYIEVGRGCRWGCSYCQTPRIHGSTERFRSPRQLESLAAAYAGFGMQDFRLLLPNALGYRSTQAGRPNCDALDELLACIASGAKSRRIWLGSFPSEVRPDYVTEDALGVLKRYVTNRSLVIGAQSGSQRILDLTHRGHTVDDVRVACRLAVSMGFEPSADIMLGFPFEDGWDREATFDLVEELGAGGTRCNMHFLMPLPGTPLSGSRPTFLTGGQRKRIDTLAQRGIVRGGWRRQEEVARAWLRRGEERSRIQ